MLGAVLPEVHAMATSNTSLLRPSLLSPGGRDKFSALGWEEFFDERHDVFVPGTNDVFNVYMAGTTGPVLFCLHGGGYTALSFAVAAKSMKARDVRVVALDLRGHGGTRTDDDGNLATDTLCNDVVSVVNSLYGGTPPAIVLIGHSMGGAIAVKLAARLLLPTLAALVVIDVVEGTAMASLVHMHAVLASRPEYFPSIEKAVEWSVRTGSLRNITSARVSVPSTLVFDSASKRYKWRTPLANSEVFWKDWYEGLSGDFLLTPVPKLLLLAGTDRLDRPLTIAQMQGKFQMLIIRHSGHAIQEDDAEEFASAVVHFVKRNCIGERGIQIPFRSHSIT